MGEKRLRSERRAKEANRAQTQGMSTLPPDTFNGIDTTQKMQANLLIMRLLCHTGLVLVADDVVIGYLKCLPNKSFVLKLLDGTEHRFRRAPKQRDHDMFVFSQRTGDIIRLWPHFEPVTDGGYVAKGIYTHYDSVVVKALYPESLFNSFRERVGKPTYDAYQVMGPIASLRRAFNLLRDACHFIRISSK